MAADGEPWAELWMGAHPRASSYVEFEGHDRPLGEVIAQYPNTFLGPEYAASAALPYLFKVLAAAQPLSIQCHPDDAQARIGFEREEKGGIPRTAAHRLYPDPTAKPELVVAHSRFVGLKGFRPVAETRANLTALGLTDLLPPVGAPDREATRATFVRLMTGTSAQRRAWLQTAVQAAKRTDSPEAQWVLALAQKFENDAGAFTPLLLNLVTLEPKQALFLRARELHAYLNGTALEVMANSDNVLRGGLTQKHIDVHELLQVLDFTPEAPTPMTPVPDGSGWSTYPTPAPQFSLRYGRVSAGASLTRRDPKCLEIVLCTDGTVHIQPDEPARPGLSLQRGQSAAIAAEVRRYTIQGLGEVFLAAVGSADV